MPIKPPYTPLKSIMHNILSKRPFSVTEKASVKGVSKYEAAFNFHDEIDDNQLLTGELN